MDSVELDDAIWAITKANELREKADWDTKVLVDEMLYQLGEGCQHCSFAIAQERAIMIDVLESYLRRRE